MAISTFDLFKIGIGPSSSHTVGPMVAARRFCLNLKNKDQLTQCQRLTVELFGSLGHTGRGHGSDKAIILGLIGYAPESIDPAEIDGLLEDVKTQQAIHLLGSHSIHFDIKKHLDFNKNESLPLHPNGMRFHAYDIKSQILLSQDYYSVGGGFVLDTKAAEQPHIVGDTSDLPYPFLSANELQEQCTKHNLSIAQLMMENEKAWRPEAEVRRLLLNIWDVMQACVQRGCSEKGHLPGGLKVKRRARIMYQELTARPEALLCDHLTILDWVNLYALAVNEENAAGGRVVTAPTNGAAGIIPAVLHYYDRFCGRSNEDGIIEFLLTAAAIAILYKENASISGAEVGCQGEVGVACSMAAAGLTAVKGGTVAQVENAAEIAMEHNLGLTCDPIGGLVQIPCIERNAMASIKAINAQRMAIRGDGKHFVSLDKVIKTMRDTGADMQSKYKETSRGGLAVNVIEC